MRSSVWGVWLGYEVLQRLHLIQFLTEQLAIGREEIPWATMAIVLVLARWCQPSSELRLAEQSYESMALADLLGVPAEKELQGCTRPLRRPGRLAQGPSSRRTGLRVRLFSGRPSRDRS